MPIPNQMSNMSSSISLTTITTATNRPIATATSSSAVETHTVKVGPKEDPHQYVPHELEANVGDLIVFEFYPRNHSVVQADWKAPCMPADGDYFFSGIKNDFKEVNGQVVGKLPTWNWTVEKDEPTFFYCTGTDSCIVNGMVGVINPNTTRTWESQNKAALEARYMLLPGQPMPAEGESSGTGSTATRSVPPSTSTSTSTSTLNPQGLSSSSSTLDAGEIAGIVIGTVTFVVILCILLFLLGRNHVYKKWFSQSHEDNSSKNVRTAQWALSTSAGGIGAGKIEPDMGSTGVPGHISVPAVSPTPETGTGFGPGPISQTGTGFVSMDQNWPQMQSGIYSGPESGYGMVSPPLSSQMQGQHVQLGQQQQQPYWIWDQSIQPHQAAADRRAGPSELEVGVFK